MGEKEFDVDHNFLKLYELKRKQREEAKNYFRKIVTNPHRPIGDPVPFDPILFRFNSLTSYTIEHFRATPRSAAIGIFYLIIPVGLIYFANMWTKKNKESKIRSGQVPYEDRMFRMLY